MQGNNGPPRDIAPSELLAKLLERPQPSEVVDFPAKSTNGTPLAQIRMMVLLMEQHDDARIRAREFLKTKRRFSDDDFRTPLGLELLGDATARELLAMACRMVDPIPGSEEAGAPQYPLLFRSSADVNKLTADEVTALFGAYLLVQKRFGPYERELDDGEVNAWIERLVEGGSALPLSSLPSHQLVELCLQLARRASCLFQLQISQPESLPKFLESLPATWVSGTSSSSEQPADDTRSDDGLITPEEAMAAAMRLQGRKV